ncbi:MAG: hypothetical protein R3D27_04080 [Hyphomicrobiaceae bacterium]
MTIARASAHVLAVFALIWAAVLPLGPAHGQSCTREDFEQVVEQATGALRALTAANRPKFQERLRQLREKRGWSHEQFVAEAAPFVRDDTIVALDRTSNELLARINRLGEDGAGAAGAPDCGLLVALRASLDGMVAAQTEKWRYMFAKIDGELAK